MISETNKKDHLEVWMALLSIFFNCCKMTLSLSWLTCALGSLGISLSIDRDVWLELSNAELLIVMLFLLDIIDAFLELPMASATYLTGRLRAARYYFLLSMCWEWYWLISYISLSSYSYNFCSYFFPSYFCLATSTIVCACSV